MAGNLRPQCSKQIFECKNIQNGDPRDKSNLFATRGMGDIAGFQRRLFSHSSTLQVQEIPLVSLPKPDIPVPGSSLWPLNSSYGVHLEVKLMAQSRGIRIHQYLPPGHPVPPRPLPGVGLGSEPRKIGVGTQTGVRVCGLPVRPLTRTGQTDPEPLGVNSTESGFYSVQFILSKFMSLIGLLTAPKK